MHTPTIVYYSAIASFLAGVVTWLMWLYNWENIKGRLGHNLIMGLIGLFLLSSVGLSVAYWKMTQMKD